jgi:LPXTG-motif cell wall-anchored protein
MFHLSKRFAHAQGDLMPTNKRLRAPLIAMFGMIMAIVAFAGPANAAPPVYPPPGGTEVLGTSASSGVSAQSAPVEVAGVSAATSGLAFTGTNAIGIGALGGLLLVGGGAMVLTARRRKDNA